MMDISQVAGDKMRRFMIKRLSKKIIGWMVLLSIMLPSCALLIQKVGTYYLGRTHKMFTAHQATCTINNIYNSELKGSISSFLSERTTRESLLSLKPQHLFDELKEKFGIIKTIDWKFLATQTLDITVIGHTPTYVVNDQWVLGEDNQLFERNDFQDFDLTSIPNISVNPKWVAQNLKPRVAKFLHKIAPNKLQSFTLSYQQPWLIELAPQQSLCKCRILADEKSFFRAEKFDAINHIFQDLCQHGFITKKALSSPKPLLTFDVRFKKQVIVRFSEPLRRGKGL